MLGILVFVVFCISIIVAVVDIIKGNMGSSNSIVVAAAIGVLYLGSASFHAVDISIVKHTPEYIANKEQRIASLKETIKLLSGNDFNAALMNDDEPISALVKAIATAEQARDSLAHDLIKTKREIDSRKLGLLSAVTWVMPDKVD